MTVRNTTAGTLPKSSYALSYRWYSADGRDRTTGSNRLETVLPADLAPGASVLVEAKVKAPSESLLGQDRERYVLAWDLRDRDRRRWLSETAGVAPLRQDVTVEHPTSDQLGLESFYQYAGTAIGAGAGLSVNAFSGNAVLDYSPIANPSRGPVTFVRLAYNSQDGSTSSLGPGWSLATSTLTRLGSPLEFQGGLLGDPERVTLVDGDGTGHHFDLNRHAASTGRSGPTTARPACTCCCSGPGMTTTRAAGRSPARTGPGCTSTSAATRPRRSTATATS
ncbi:DUF6531 domain-containing protein [Micromonospora sp. WMMD1102]|uniref:DUF6531 domain-containing protein n=1 Tax=Micromonospora sp. WMMD1102 TaxID=3016105 RepID=UPI0024151B3A|nr:DUF6531 domain-containing protein [Micromonospora sp. WMMD1102]MDG4787599.1 DUF6531 domain-containing protein [Micromonospora sp. WMMD1102]